MGAWIDRSAHLPGGVGYEFRIAAGREPLEVPNDVAGWRRNPHDRDGGKLVEVTWGEIMEIRRAHQRERLDGKLRLHERRGVWPAQLWVFCVEGWLFAGWYCYVRDISGGKKREWAIKGKGAYRDACAVQMHLMRHICCGVLPAVDAFPQWMEAFAEAYPKRPTKEDPRKAGQVAGWTDGKCFWLTKREALEGVLL